MHIVMIKPAILLLYGSGATIGDSILERNIENLE